MHRADALADALDLGQHVRTEEDRLPALAGFVDHVVELALRERVETAGRLVEDQELGLVHERLDQSEPALVAGREVAGAAREVEALGERRHLRSVDAVAQTAEVAQGLVTGQPRVQRVLPGEVADTAADGDAVAVRMQTEHLGGPRRRPDKVEQEADGRRLADAVGPEEAEHGAGRDDREIQADHAAAAAVLRGQASGLDHLSHRALFPVAQCAGAVRRSFL